MRSKNKFAICVFSDKESLLTPRKIYQVLADPTAERSDYLRIIDNEGEDYLYPEKYFIVLPIPQNVEDVPLQVA